jgi:hypothetical protein
LRYAVLALEETVVRGEEYVGVGKLPGRLELVEEGGRPPPR